MIKVCHNIIDDINTIETRNTAVHHRVVRPQPIAAGMKNGIGEDSRRSRRWADVVKSANRHYHNRQVYKAQKGLLDDEWLIRLYEDKGLAPICQSSWKEHKKSAQWV